MQRVERSRSGGLVVLVLGGVLLGGCAEAPEDAAASGTGPATVESIEGSEVSLVTLTEEAVARLGLSTTAVAVAAAGADGGAGQPTTETATRTIIPYGAVIYDNTGATWAYTNPELLVYVREPITIDRIEGDEVFLLDGPAVGTDVVTIGAAELYGAELGLGQ